MFSKPKNDTPIVLNGLFLDEEGKQSGAYFMAITVIKELLILDSRYRLITTQDFDWARGRSIYVPKFKKVLRFFVETYYRNIYKDFTWVHFDYFLPYRLLGRRHVDLVVIHDLLPLDIPKSVSKYKLKWFSHQVRRSISRSYLVITISNFCKSRFAYHYPGFVDKIVVISNPVDLLRFNNKNLDPSNFGNTPYFLTVSAPWPHKNLQTLVKAVEASYAVNAIPLFICGTRSKLLSNLNESEAVRFLGYLSDAELANAITNACLIMVPSLYEGFGMTVYEGLALGQYVLASDLEVYGSLPNLIRVQNPHLSHSWLDAIENFLGNPPVKESVDLSDFEPRLIAEKYDEVIKKSDFYIS